MAFVKTIDIISNNGTTYADTAEFQVAHGPCGTMNESFVTDSSMTLLDGGTGVRVVLTYVDQATHDEHGGAGLDALADVDVTTVSAV
jgi:hypothetical protein